MNNALRLSSSLLGIYAGLLGIEHGIFELLQGNTPPDGLLIHAIGSPCQPDTVWHACFPALTLVPNLLACGILSILIGAGIAIWAAGFIQYEKSGPVLVLLSILLLGVGGGFVPAYTGVVAGISAIRYKVSYNWWQLSTAWFVRILGKLWPWSLILMGLWCPGSWLAGYFYGKVILKMGFGLFLFWDIGLPVLIILSAFAYDTQRRLPV